MRELMFVACVAIYFGIIGLLIYDTVDQIRRKDDWRNLRRDHHPKFR